MTTEQDKTETDDIPDGLREPAPRAPADPVDAGGHAPVPSTPAKPVPPRTTPGELLRNARTAKNLSIADLTSRTMLSASTIEALEDNDFGELSQPVFVRGYYRKCAKVLDIPEDEIMSAYANCTGVAGPRPASPRQVDVVPQDVTPGNVRLFGVVAMMVAAVALGVLAWMFMSDGEEAIADAVGQTSPASSESADAVGSAVASSPSIDSAPAQPGQNATPQAENTPATVATSRLGTPDRQGEKAVEAQPPAAQTEPESEPEPETEREPVQTSASNRGLRLEFSQRSWIEVRDANGRLMLGGIVEAGNERIIEKGRSPYSISLGYAPGVNVFADGREVEFSSRIRGNNTASLKVEVGQ